MPNKHGLLTSEKVVDPFDSLKINEEQNNSTIPWKSEHNSWVYYCKFHEIGIPNDSPLHREPTSILDIICKQIYIYPKVTSSDIQKFSQKLKLHEPCSLTYTYICAQLITLMLGLVCYH